MSDKDELNPDRQRAALGKLTPRTLTEVERALRDSMSGCHCSMSDQAISPCDGWLQHRQCYSVDSAVAAQVWAWLEEGLGDE